MTTYELHFRCPDIRSQEDALVVSQTLANSPGVELAEVDLPTHSVRVRTANQDGGEDVRRKLIDSGYPPEEA